MRSPPAAFVVLLALASSDRASASTPQDRQLAHCIAALNAGAVVARSAGNLRGELQLRLRAFFEVSRLPDVKAIETAKAESLAFTREHVLPNTKEGGRILRDCLRAEDADPRYHRFIADALRQADAQAR